MTTFARKRAPRAPAGADEAELVAGFSSRWELEHSERDVEPPPSGPSRACH